MDVVCVTETWLSDEIPDSAVAMYNFILFRNDCPSHAGGVGIYGDCKIPCKQLPEYPLSGSITESLWLQLRPVRLPRKISVILLGIVYHPPRANAADNNNLYSHVQSVVDSFLRTHPDCFIWIVGDFNPTSTNISDCYFKCAIGLTQIVKVLTRDTGILDWCLTNHPKLFPPPIQLPKIGSSDHYCVLMHPNLLSAKQSKQTKILRDTRNSNMREFGRWRTQFSWHELHSLGSCSEKFEYFHQALVNAIDYFFPVKVSRVQKSDKPWMTHRIKSSISKRQKCLTKYCKDSPIFKMWRNRVQHLIRYRKSSFYSTKIKSLKNTNVSKWWKAIKSLAGISGKEGQWYNQLIDGDNIDSV